MDDPLIGQYGSVLSPFPNAQVLKSPDTCLEHKQARDLILTIEYDKRDGCHICDYVL